MPASWCGARRGLKRGRDPWVAVVALALVACDRPDAARRPPVGVPAEIPAAPAAKAAPAPAWFDAGIIQPGDTVAGMRAERVDLRRTPQNEPVGSVHFSGRTELTGEYRPHFDYPEPDIACFWVDSASWHRIPHLRSDTRTQLWFCFRNQDDAIRDLGPLRAGLRVPTTIVIDSFTTHITFSDAWDEANLISIAKPRASHGQGTPPP